jgi:hypothetical protein
MSELDKISAFPALRAVLPQKVESGVIVWTARSKTKLVALTTDQKAESENRALVLLNFEEQKYPKVIYAEDWRLSDSLIVLDEKIEFEIDQNPKSIDERGADWRETAGVIVVLGDRLHIRAYRPTSGAFFSNHELIDIQSGAVYSGELPNRLWSFGRWSLWIKDKVGNKVFKLCEFSV